MHLPSLTSLALPLPALFTTTSADFMASYRECAVAGSACRSHRAVWFTSYDAQDINADSGCRTGAGSTREFCADWSMAPPRGHFYYHRQLSQFWCDCGRRFLYHGITPLYAVATLIMISF
ncbi:hypothetical protein B0T14DRAFT_495599 [Immersiella caudata]|uniref:Uncharacterized protein n=1 Tax=Immersiella caudata TaxID=314043 RepID=A0AA39WZ43_9PEZI|nr:hypothetical protein B0T14DRAFT_495599 [Immersiella caudata]